MDDISVYKKFNFDQIIFFADTVTEFEVFLKIYNEVAIRPIKIILVLSNTKSNLRQYTKCAWKYDIADIIIISVNHNTEIALSTFQPYKNNICGDITPFAVNVTDSSLFNKKFKNFHKCPIRVAVHPVQPYLEMEMENGSLRSIKGFNADIINIVIEGLNSTIQIVPPYGSEKKRQLANLTWPEYNTILTNESDILIPAIFLNDRRYSESQISYPVHYMTLVWCAPKQREIYVWAKVILPFASHTTPLIVFAIVAFVITLKLIFRFKSYKIPIVHVMFQIVSLFFGQGVKYETKYWLNNVTYLLWILLCFILRIAYQCDLINDLHKVTLEPPLVTFDNAVEHVDEIVAVKSILDLYKNVSIIKPIRIISVDDYSTYLKRLDEGERILGASDITLIKYGLYDVQVLDELVGNIPCYYFMRPRWLASADVTDMLHRVSENGYIVKFYYYYRDLWMRHKTGIENNESIASLNIRKLISCFYGLIAMYVICLFILLFELFWHKLRNSK
ncbi:uncharacterized protein LOC126979116 [Leptidea sinapis]|uniref:uncharacterized protein LOC126979116 n=1 Tax=Leptidea sinapis TaxID=189913 RepID=UPI0021C3BC16|nr:uncharacterized protein LOC126979116 [Leptidea sinapis]